MGWRRLGRLYRPERGADWCWSHAANPFAEALGGDRYRVYFSPRDRESRSSIAAAVLDLAAPGVRTDSLHRVLGPGPPGSFDERGTTMGCLVRRGDARYLYYLGWSLPPGVPWRCAVGLAISRDGSTFEKVGPGPVLGPDAVDGLSLSYPWVIAADGGWRMWLGAQTRWAEGPGNGEHVLRHAESADGATWRPTGEVCLPARPEPGSAYSRPCVLYLDGRYRMWFSFRRERYEIGYAESADGLSWDRIDGQRALGPDGDGWESEAVEYAHVFPHRDRLYALYCGNGYGATGFGLAVEE